jgi:hypothetical protein
LQHHLQFDSIADWDSIQADERDFRFQAAVSINRVDVDGGDDKAALLVEAQGMDVIVSGDQPHPPALLLTRGLLGRFDERRAHPQALTPGILRDDFAGLALDVIGEQADDFGINFSDETGQLGRAIDGLVGDDGLAPQDSAVRRATQSWSAAVSGRTMNWALVISKYF